MVISVDDLLYLLANGGIPKEDYSKIIQQVKSTCKGKELPQSPTEIFKLCASDAVAKVLSKVLNPNTASWLVEKVKEEASRK